MVFILACTASGGVLKVDGYKNAREPLPAGAPNNVILSTGSIAQPILSRMSRTLCEASWFERGCDPRDADSFASD